MDKLCVLVSGLAVLAQPNKTDASAKVLLRRVPKPTNVKGHKIPAHHGFVRFFSAAGLHDVDLGKGETVTFTPNGGGRPLIPHPELFISVGPGLNRPSPVKASFRNGAPDATILAGRVVLTGGTINAIELKQILELGQVDRTITTELREATVLGSAAVPVPPRPVANGFLFEREIAQGVTPSIKIGTGASVPLAPTQSADLGFLKPAGKEKVYVVWVINTPRPPGHGNGAVPPAPVPPPPVDPVGFDADFDLLYDFVQGKQTRLVPVLFTQTLKPGIPPGRCSPGLGG
jgi:hypothetical protein